MSDVLFRTATEAAAAVRGGEISSRELTAWQLDRIDAANPILNAVVELRPEEALAEAASADEATARGEALGPLHGVPMTIKEAFNLAGLHTTWGNPAFKDYVPRWDATVVSRLRRAGAIVVGKTNVAAMLADYGQTANDLYGVTNNPWNISHAAGGSSGGAAAAVVAGLAFLDYGSDLVGSIRLPASYCGVYGLRPSVNIVPRTGFQPPGPPAEPSDMTSLVSVGPLTRSADDLRVALTATAGPEAPTSRAYSWSLPPARHIDLTEFRVRVVLDHPRAPTSSEIADRLSDTIDALAQAGATVEEGWSDGVDPVEQHRSFGFGLGEFFGFVEAADDFATFGEIVEHEHRRMAARTRWARCFGDVDVFICPTSFTPAFPHDHRAFAERTIRTPEGDRAYDDQTFWISQPALPGLPTVSAPIGQTATGLPVGIQIIGPLYEDNTPITFAELLGKVTGGYQQPPINDRTNGRESDPRMSVKGWRRRPSGPAQVGRSR